MRFYFTLLILSIATVVNAQGPVLKEIKCKIQMHKWNSFAQPLKECLVQDQAITAPGFNIATPEDPSVEGLSFRHNKQAFFIPNLIAEKFRNIIALSFANCSLKSITYHNLKNLQKVQALYLAKNEIETIESSAFKDMTALDYLSLSENRLDFVSPHYFVFNGRLKNLLLQGNRIEAIGLTAFDTLRHLEELNLKDNRIQFLPDDTFTNLINVKNISLKNNQLTEVKEVHFKKNTKLSFVWLDTNQVKYVDARAFDGKKDLQYVDLRVNSCINKVYRPNQFADMKKDIKKNCLPLSEKVQELKTCNLKKTELETKLNGCNSQLRAQN